MYKPELKKVWLYPEEIDEICRCLKWGYRWRWLLSGNPLKRRSLAQQLEAVKLTPQERPEDE
jgi:hypothetical protein